MKTTDWVSRSCRVECKRRQLVLVFAVCLGLVMTGCGGGNDDVFGLSASLSESGTAAQNNGIRLIEGSTSGDIVTIEVVCGETDRDDVYGFAFDLVLSDPSVAEYLAGSVEAGDAFPGNVIATAEQNGERIVIGVSQTDQTGDPIPGPESVVIRLALKALEAGTTGISFQGSTGSNPTTDPAAVDSSGALIGTIVFDAASATIISM